MVLNSIKYNWTEYFIRRYLGNTGYMDIVFNRYLSRFMKVSYFLKSLPGSRNCEQNFKCEKTCMITLKNFSDFRIIKMYR